MKRFKLKQYPFTPLVILVMIMCGYTVGAKNEKSAEFKETMNKNLLVDETLSEIDTDNAIDPEVIKNISNQLQGAKDEAISGQEQDTQGLIEEEKEQATNAELALETGVHIAQEIENAYAKQTIEDYCSRTVVACTSKNLSRYSEEWLFRQTFDSMTGYKGLVKINALAKTKVHFEVLSDMKEVTTVLIFPDQSYVVLEINEEISIDLPVGDSTILYVGEGLSGSIEAKLQKNDSITCKRM